MVLRVISTHIRTLEELQLPAVLRSLSEERRGLILVTGATGSGKSTTLAAMLQRINTERASHIITIEDPIEFNFKDERSTVNQREIGIDSESFGS
ncbi:MAG: ATPase, T2SS/T4P/T4SS family, partial [Nostoc sp.]